MGEMMLTISKGMIFIVLLKGGVTGLAVLVFLLSLYYFTTVVKPGARVGDLNVLFTMAYMIFGLMTLVGSMYWLW